MAVGARTRPLARRGLALDRLRAPFGEVGVGEVQVRVDRRAVLVYRNRPDRPLAVTYGCEPHDGFGEVDPLETLFW